MYPYKQVHPKGRRLDEHRHVMEQALGRRLTRFEFVHHINGNKRDNRLENLQLVTPKQHAHEHGQQKHPLQKNCVVCGSIFTPSPTKRGSKKTCSKVCRYTLTAYTQSNPNSPRSQYRVDAAPSEVASRSVPQQAAEFIRACMT